MNLNLTAFQSRFAELQSAEVLRFDESRAAFFHRLIDEGLGWACIPWSMIRNDSELQKRLYAAHGFKRSNRMPEHVSMGIIGLAPAGRNSNSIELEALDKTTLPRIFQWRGNTGFRLVGELEACQQTAEEVILRIVMGFPSALINVVAADFQFMAGLHPPYFQIPEENRRQITEPRQFIEFLGSEFVSGLNRTLADLGKHGCKSVDEWNQRADLSPKPYYILLIANLENLLEEIYKDGRFARVNEATNSIPEFVRLTEAILSGSCAVAGIYVLACSNGTSDPIRGLEDVSIGSNEIVLLSDVAGFSSGFKNLSVRFEYLGPDGIAWVKDVFAGRKYSLPVPFPESDWWSQVSAARISVPLGVGDDDTPTCLEFGGSSNHALVGGRTGMGKSTALHSLILGFAQLYSPDEVRFALIDLKDGTEFRSYRHLPHLYALAIGQNLDWTLLLIRELRDEMQRRNAMFRGRDTANLEDFRKATDESVPRIVVIIDEFQKLTTDDRFRDEARAILSALIQQGRSAGIHFVLATQTMQGNYPLPDNILNQLMTRIAFQLSRDDCHSFLSAGNDVPSHFQKQGQGIFNDQAGNIFGNVAFQCVYYPDEIKRQTVEALRRRMPGGAMGFSPYIYEADDFIDYDPDGQDANKICLCYSSALRPEPVSLHLGKDRTLAVIGGRDEVKRRTVRQVICSQLERIDDAEVLWYGEWDRDCLNIDMLTLEAVAPKSAEDSTVFAGANEATLAFDHKLLGIPIELAKELEMTGKAMMDFSFDFGAGPTGRGERLGSSGSSDSKIYVVQLGNHPPRLLEKVRGAIDHLIQIGARVIVFDESAAVQMGRSLSYADFTARLYLDETSARNGTTARAVPPDLQLKQFEGILDFYANSTVSLLKIKESETTSS
jgi:hypothetical protein